ncbi:hypothetical protein YB2330_006112 [Saitoella coloradoensis]
MAMALRTRNVPSDANRILFVKNISFKVKDEELWDLFGRYGAVRQIRMGDTTATKGTAYVVYEDVMDAKTACEKLSGFNFADRYLVVMYHQPEKIKATDLSKKEAELERLKARHNIE